MFGGGFPFGNDIFGNIHQQMRQQVNQMDQMMNSMMDPFGNSRRMMIDNGSNNHGNDLAFYQPGFGGLFSGLFNQGRNLQSMVSDPNSHVYSHSTTITFDGSGGRPRVVEESMRKAGAVQETRHSVRTGDETGVGDRMLIEHTIGDRSHIIEKKRGHDGRVHKKQHFVNLDEERAEQFDREFANSTLLNSEVKRSNALRAIEASTRERRHGKNNSSAPIITLPDDDEPSHSRRSYKNSYQNGGPVIKEVTEDENESYRNNKKRKGFSRLFKADQQ